MENIKKTDIAQEFEDSFLRYAMSVITDRALPDIRDGLKPVHRRIVYDMLHSLNLKSNKPYVKSARIVGDVIGLLHPHGDSSVYDAACRMTLDYVMRYPLIDGQGSFGSIDGDGAAAQRYTEMRPNKLMELMTLGIKNNAVDMVPNFSQDYLEPTILPSLFPNILCNPSSGIAVGMACNFAPHNLVEVCDAIINYIKNDKKSTLEDIMKYIKGPDFPLGGTIINPSEIKKAYATGKSSVSLKIRGDYIVKGDTITFTSIPYGVTENKIKTQVSENVDILSKYISDFSSSTNRNGIKIEFTVIDENNIEEALAYIFKYTKLQSTFSINNVCLVDNKPKQVSLLEIIDNYVDFVNEIKIRISKFNIDKLEERIHILKGLIIAYLNIDEVISIIRSSSNKEIAKQKLMKNYALDEIQTLAILDRKLSSLTKLNEEDLKNELEEKAKERDRNMLIVNDNKVRNELIIKELEELSKSFGDERRTKIIEIKEKTIVKAKEGKKVEPIIIGIYNNGLKTVKTKKVAAEKVIETNTGATLIGFTKDGMALKASVENIKDTIMKNNILFNSADTILETTVSTEDSIIYQVTSDGMIKASDLKEYITPKNVVSIKLNEKAEVKSVYCGKPKYCYIKTNIGEITFDLIDVKVQGRATKGVKALKLKENEEILEVSFEDIKKECIKKRGSVSNKRS